MNKEKLIDAIGMIDDEYIEEAHSNIKKKRSFSLSWSLAGKVLTAACAILLAINIIPALFHPYKEANGGGSYYASEYKADSADYDYDGYASYAPSYPMEEAEAMIEDAGSSQQSAISDNGNIRQNKKLILTANMSLETQDLDALLENLLPAVERYGGYVQSSSIGSRNGNSRYYNATIRIPAGRYNDFLGEVKSSGNSTFFFVNATATTEIYTDIEARLNSLKAQEAKVLEFYDKAETIEDLMSVESRLSDIRYEIEYLEAQIKNYDLLVSYSTLNLTVNETTVYTPVSQNFFARLGRSFVNGFKNFVSDIGDFVIDIVYNIWTILFLILIGFIVYRIYRWFRNRKKA